MNNSSLVWLFGNRVVFCSSKTATLYTAATLYTVKYCLYDHSIKRTTPLQSTTQYKGPPRYSRPLNKKGHPLQSTPVILTSSGLYKKFEISECRQKRQQRYADKFCLCLTLYKCACLIMCMFNV